MKLLSILLAADIRVVPGHRDETVCVDVSHSAHVESGDDEVHGQLAHVTNSYCRLGRGLTQVEKLTIIFLLHTY